MEHEPGMRRVVVGDEHDRSLGIGVAHLRHHVPGRAVRQDRATKPATAVTEVVPQGGGAGAGQGRGDRASVGLARRKRECAARRGERVHEPDRPPVAAVRALLLDGEPAARAPAGARR